MPTKREKLGPARFTRLRPADDRYLMALSAKFRIKPSWYVRSAVEEWIARRKDKKRSER